MRKKWQNEHFPTQELEPELPFYYNVYQKIFEVASQSVKKIDDFYIIQLLMHIENVAHLHDDEIADNMVSSSFAFDWKDKEGKSVLERLGDCFEDLGDADVAKSLSSVRGVRLDCYQVVAFGKGMLTLQNKDGEVFENMCGGLYHLKNTKI